MRSRWYKFNENGREIPRGRCLGGGVVTLGAQRMGEFLLENGWNTQNKLCRSYSGQLRLSEASWEEAEPPGSRDGYLGTSEKVPT